MELALGLPGAWEQSGARVLTRLKLESCELGRWLDRSSP